MLRTWFVYNELVTLMTRMPVTSADIPRYQVAIDIRRKNPLIVERGAPLVAKFTENLVPGKTYQVKFFVQSFFSPIVHVFFLSGCGQDSVGVGGLVAGHRQCDHAAPACAESPSEDRGRHRRGQVPVGATPRVQPGLVQGKFIQFILVTFYQED